MVIAVGAALALGFWRAMTDGRLRGTHQVAQKPRRGVIKPGTGSDLETADPASSISDRPWADQLGERGTLVQFSSAFCAPCRTTRQVLAAVAEAVPGVTHVEIDAEHHLELVRELGIFRTPTTLILGPDGAERLRASGVPKRDQVIAAL